MTLRGWGDGPKARHSTRLPRDHPWRRWERALARLPTKEEARSLEETRLAELWTEVCSSPKIHRFASGATVYVCSCHASPHFHLLGPDCCAVIAVDGLTIVGGEAPRAVLAEVKKWAAHPASSKTLRYEWERLKGLDTFFDRLESKVGVPLDRHFQIRVVQAMVRYCRLVKYLDWADPKLMAGVKRLVELTGGRIVALRKTLKQFDPTSQSVNDFYSDGLQRECWPIYQSANEHYEDLLRLADHFPDRRLAEVVSAVSAALWKVAPPFWAIDCNAALSILDGLLANWGDSTGIKRGKRVKDRALDDLIGRLAVVFEARSEEANNHFMPFLKCILAALPILQPDSGEALDSRVKRVKARFSQPTEFTF
jgi:hypothetical protein